MKRFALMTTAAMVAALATAAHAANAARADFSWQQPHARVLPNGDLEWAPKAFVFEKGASVRYIDFDAGDDTKDGRTRQTAWKHHPWDASAAGLARECTGIHTYVFKRGVAYRGMLKASDSGKQGNPIRLTSDPAWGTGEAALYGSTMVTGGWKRCAAADAPAGMPEPRKVWYLDIGTEFNPRCVFETRTAAIHRIHIARNPNFSESNPDDLMADWFTWTGPSN
ncbi:hypothetical protein GX586_12390 [bacterium]|nr:hypothetical protein [bacterium]